MKIGPEIVESKVELNSDRFRLKSAVVDVRKKVCEKRSQCLKQNPEKGLTLSCHVSATPSYTQIALQSSYSAIRTPAAF